MENLTLFPLYQTTCFFISFVAPCKPLLACENIYDSTYAEMEGCIDALEQGDDPEEQVYQFHYRLTQASGNGIYSMFFRAFEPVIRRS